MTRTQSRGSAAGTLAGMGGARAPKPATGPAPERGGEWGGSVGAGAARGPGLEVAGLVEAAAVGMALVAPDGAIELANGALERLLGRREGELVGVPLAAVFPCAARSDLDGAARRRGVSSVECDVRRAGGERVRVRVSVSPLRVGWSRGGALVTVEDLSGQREAQLRAEDASAQLRHAARLSVAGELAGALAHEMGQPLATVANYTQAALVELSRTGRCSEGVLSNLRNADAAARRGSRVVRNLAAFVRAGGGGPGCVARERANLGEVVGEVEWMLRSAGAACGARVDVQVCDAVLPVEVDRVQVQQVVLNLVKNAGEAVAGVDADGASGGDGAGERRDGAVLVRIWSPEVGVGEVVVRDAGPGLSPAALARLFTPYFTTKAQGMGLGLAICRSIIEGHGGELVGENNPPPAPGATFRFRLPLVVTHGDQSYDG